MATNSVSLSAQSASLNYEPALPTQPRLSSAQTVAAGEGSNDSIIKKVEVTLVKKPKDVAVGEYLTRQALEKIAPDYGLSSTDIGLEIQYVKDKKNGDFINDLNFGGKAIAKPNNLTNEQVNALVAAGHKTVDFGVHQSTVERMLQRTAVVKWIAEKEAFGGQLSTEDMSDLAKLGYTDKDVANLCKTKFMEYGGFQTRFQTEVEAKAKQQVYQDTRNDLKGTLFEEHAKANAQGSAEAFDLLMNAEVKNRVDDKLRYGKKSAVQYLTEQEGGKQRITEKGELNERLKQYSVSDYLAEGGKNLVNSFYWNVGEAVKGLSLVAMNSSLHFDQNGKPVEPKLKDTLGYKIGDWMQQNVQAPNVNRDIEQSIAGGTLPKTVGGLLPAVFGAWVTKSPTATVSIYDGLRTGGGVYDEAKRSGANETQAQRAALITGGFVGLTDRFGYGKTLETLNTGAGATAWQGIFKEAIKDGARNAGVAGVQTVFENGVAKNIYDPNRGYLDNVQERMIAAGITGATLRGGLEIIAKVHAGVNPTTLAETQRVFKVEKPLINANAKQIEYRNSGVDLKAKLNEKLKTIEESKVPTVEAEKLDQIREKLSDNAKIEFDAMRKTQKSDSVFLQVISKNDPIKMLEGIAAKKANQPNKLKLEQEALEKARLQIDNSQFINKPLVKTALEEKEIPIEVVREQISIEVVKPKLEVQYPKSQGYEIQTGVKIYKDSGYKTINDWLKGHPHLNRGNTSGLIEQDGKVWQPQTDMDIAVVRKTPNGKFELTHTEEVKSGGKDTASKAQEQVKATQMALEKIKNGDNSVKIFVSRKDVTENYQISDDLKSITRGADDRMHFDEKVGLTSKQLNQLAEELIKKHKKGVGN